MSPNLEWLLQNLVDNTPGATHALVLSRDGLKLCHTSGLAMRFPRILRIRRDKTPEQIDTVESARRLVKGAA